MSAIIRISIDYTDSKIVNNWDDETWTRVMSICEGKKPEKREEQKYGFYCGNLLVDDEELNILSSAGLDIRLRSMRSLVSSIGWPQPKTPVTTDVMVAHTVESYLFDVSDVKNLDNACTDDLREELKDGWRIIAICPQPGQRRPDYILGKREKD